MSVISGGHAPVFRGVAVPHCQCDICRIKAAVVDAVLPDGTGVVGDPASKIDPLASVLGEFLAMLKPEVSDEALERLRQGVNEIRAARVQAAKHAQAMAQEPAGRA